VSESNTFLGKMKRGESGIIEKTSGPMEIRRRLLEMGFLEGSRVEIVHEAPFGKDPIAVKVRGALLALRREEANHVEIREVQTESSNSK
jgi:Fe2+ transport system protein FeoA